MSSPIQLVGLDFGSTTSSAMAAVTRVQRHPLSSRMEVAEPSALWHSPLVFTPFESSPSPHPRLDLHTLAQWLDRWLEQVRQLPGTLFGGGALVTGLAARAPNAAELAALVRTRLGEALIAPVGDPCLESWMAFMGSVAPLSRRCPEQPLLNLDIGGGTTNLALGQAGEVHQTGCLLVGARHFRFTPGTFQLRACSEHGQALLDALSISVKPGEVLCEAHVHDILQFYLDLLEAACTGDTQRFESAVAALHCQVPLYLPEVEVEVEAKTKTQAQAPRLTFSGGVGELLYALRSSGEPLPRTQFGDLGGELATRLLAHPYFSQRLLSLPDHAQPALEAHPQRATVLGLLRHSTYVSGATLYLSKSARLPLSELPILGRLDEAMSQTQLEAYLRLVAASPVGGCLQLTLPAPSPARLSAFAARVRGGLKAVAFPERLPLVLLVAANLGKVLGGSITRWGQEPWTLLVLDELESPGAQFLQLGRPHGAVLPVSFYGMTFR